MSTPTTTTVGSAAIAVAAALSLGAIGGATVSTQKPIPATTFKAPTGQELVRAEYRFRGDLVGVFFCYRVGDVQGCPDAALIDFQKAAPSVADVQSAFTHRFAEAK